MTKPRNTEIHDRIFVRSKPKSEGKVISTYKRYQHKRVKRGDKDYPKGRWYAEGQIDGVRYHLALKSAATQEDARRCESEIISKIRNDDFDFHKDKTSLFSFIDEVYLPYSELNNASYKQKIYECNYLKTFFKNALLKSITPQRCEQYKAWRRVQKKRCQKCISGTHKGKCEMPAVANSTVNRELTTLKKLFSLAVANRKLKENPMRFVKLLAEPPPRERFLSTDEKTRLLESVAQDKKLQAIVLLALLTGWRKSQILSVRKSDLDFEHLVILRKKSKRSPARKVPVSGSAWNIFASLAANADDYLFTNRDGEPLKDFKESWWNALKRAKIEGLRFHDLRHQFSSELILSGANPLVVRDALGHAQLSTTEIYMQLQSPQMQKALDDHAENNPDYVM